MAHTKPTRLDPPALHLPANQPVTIAFQTGEIETIHLLDAGPAWSYTPQDGLRYAAALLPQGKP